MPKTSSSEPQIKHLFKLIEVICSGDYDDRTLLTFVNVVQKISLSYLKHQERKGKRLCWHSNDQRKELEDLALDCIAGLFMRDENGAFTQLRKYFYPYLREADAPDDLEVLVLLKRLVIKKTKQELSRIFKIRNPEGAKTVRNIKIAVKSNSDLGSFRKLGREFVYFKKQPSISNGVGRDGFSTRSMLPENGQASIRRTNQPIISEDLLWDCYLDVFCLKDPVSQHIRKMLTVVERDKRYQDCLPLDMISRIIQKTNRGLFQHNVRIHTHEPSPLDVLRQKEIEKVKAGVLKKLRYKIENRYVNTNKISSEKGRIYYQALCDILDEISHGRRYDSYYRHLKQFYMPHLTQKAYRAQERTVFEYLGKLMKKWFREEVVELL